MEVEEVRPWDIAHQHENYVLFSHLFLFSMYEQTIESMWRTKLCKHIFIRFWPSLTIVAASVYFRQDRLAVLLALAALSPIRTGLIANPRQWLAKLQLLLTFLQRLLLRPEEVSAYS